MTIQVGGGITISGGIGIVAGGSGPGPAPSILTVTGWELGRVSTNPAFLQISCPNNTGSPYTTLAAVTSGTQLILIRGAGNITVTTTQAPTLASFLNRVTFSNLTGANIPAGTGSLATGTQIQIVT